MKKRKGPVKPYELIVVGTSLGGLHALRMVLGAIPEGFSVPIAVVQHRHKDSGDVLATILSRAAAMPVVEVEDRQRIEPGRIYLAPADYHLFVEKGSFSLSEDAAELYSRPSIDLLFESAADAYGEQVIAVIMTGANHDGARGAGKVKKRGGMVIAEDPETAEAPAMPAAAIAEVDVDQILPLDRIAPYLVDVCRTSVAR